MAFAATKRKRIKGRMKKVGQLPLTSLIDIFTNILVFLLLNYSAVEMNVQVQQNLHLPTSISQKLPVDTVILTVAKNVIMVDGDAVLRVNESNFEVDGIASNEPSLPGLTSILKKKYEQFSNQAKRRGEEYKGEITVQADRDIPYLLIKRVIKSAGDASFANFKMMAFKEDSL